MLRFGRAPARASGRCRGRTREQVDGPISRLTVENDGRDIDPAEAVRLAEPFRRLGTDRTGSEDGVGLGLAIVTAIAAAHQGTLRLRSRPQGGLSAIVELPRAGALAAPGAGQ